MVFYDDIRFSGEFPDLTKESLCEDIVPPVGRRWLRKFLGGTKVGFAPYRPYPFFRRLAPWPFLGSVAGRLKSPSLLIQPQYTTNAHTPGSHTEGSIFLLQPLTPGSGSKNLDNEMNRRAFIDRTLLAAGAACMPWPVSGESPYLEDHAHNWWAWRESLKRVLEETGHTFRSAELERPIGGFRRATMHVTDETGTAKTLIWLQPWRGNRIDE